MKREIKLFCSSNVASVFLKPIILHGIYALNLEKRREKMLVFSRRGVGVILNCVVEGGFLGGGGLLYPQQRIKEAFTSSYRIKVV